MKQPMNAEYNPYWRGADKGRKWEGGGRERGRREVVGRWKEDKRGRESVIRRD